MSINKYDTPYVPFDYPIEAMLKMGQISEQRADRGNDALDKFQAALSSINPAPGHEDYAKDVIGKYYKEAEDLVNSGIKPNDPRFLSGTRKMAYKLANDQDVKTINNSRRYYDEIIAKTLPEVINKAGIAEMEGAMQGNNFIQNRRNYDNFRFYTGDFNKEIDDTLAQVKTRVSQGDGSYGAFYHKNEKNPNDPLNGSIVWYDKSGKAHEWLDEDTLKATSESFQQDVSQSPNSSSARQLYFKTPGKSLSTLADDIRVRMPKYYVDRKTGGNKGGFRILSGDKNKQSEGFDMSIPGHPLLTGNNRTDSYSLKKTVEDINKEIPVLKAELEAHRKSGQYPADSRYLLDKESAIAAKQEMASRYQTAYNNEMEKASSSLTKEERALYEKYKNFEFDPKQTSLEEISAIRNSTVPHYAELNKGLTIRERVVEEATKNVSLNRVESIVPGLILSTDDKANTSLDKFIERAVVGSSVYDPITMNAISSEDMPEYSYVTYGGYTKRPIGKWGRMLGVQFRDKEGKVLKTAYMAAPQNFKAYLTSQNKGSGEELDIQDKLALIKDDPLLPEGNIIIDGENYGKLEIPSRVSPRKTTKYDSNPDLIFWIAPDGKRYPTDIVSLARTIKNLRQANTTK